MHERHARGCELTAGWFRGDAPARGGERAMTQEYVVYPWAIAFFVFIATAGISGLIGLFTGSAGVAEMIFVFSLGMTVISFTMTCGLPVPSGPPLPR